MRSLWAKARGSSSLLDRTILSKEGRISRKSDGHGSPKWRSSAIAVQRLWGWRHVSIWRFQGILYRQSPTAYLAMPLSPAMPLSQRLNRPLNSRPSFIGVARVARGLSLPDQPLSCSPTTSAACSIASLAAALDPLTIWYIARRYAISRSLTLRRSATNSL